MLAWAARSVRGGYRHHCYCRSVGIIAMKLRWILAVLMAAMSLVAVGSAASANTVFKVSNNPWTTYFGTLTIDTVNGLVVSGDMWVKFRLPKAADWPAPLPGMRAADASCLY